MIWRLRIQNPDGTFKALRGLDVLALDDFKLVFSPGCFVKDGIAYLNMVEASFKARPDSLGIAAHDWVQLEVQGANIVAPPGTTLEQVTDAEGTWDILGKGECLLLGDANAKTKFPYRLVGAKDSRLTKTYVPKYTYPEGDAGAMMRSAVQDVLPQVGAALTYDADLIPDVAVTVGKRLPFGESLSALMNSISSQAGQTWGTSGGGMLWSGPLDETVMEFNARTDSHSIEFKGLQAEDTVTATLWFVRVPETAYVPENVSAGAFYVSITEAASTLQGPLDNTRQTIPGYFYVSKKDPASTISWSSPEPIQYQMVLKTFRPVVVSTEGTVTDAASAFDGSKSSFAQVGPDGAGASRITGSLDITGYLPVRVFWRYRVNKDHTDSGGFPSAFLRMEYEQTNPPGNVNRFVKAPLKTGLGSGDPEAEYSFIVTPDVDWPDMTGVNTLSFFLVAGIDVTLEVYDVWVECIDLSALDALAQEFYVSPADVAATAKRSGEFVVPSLLASVTKRDGTTLGPLPVALVEWHIQKGQGYYSVFNLGEPEPGKPSALAAEAIRKQRLKQAQLASVTVSSGR